MKYTWLLVLFFVGFQYNATCQDAALDANEWAIKLADPYDIKNEAFFKLIPLAKDSASASKFLAQLQKEPAAKGNYFLARYNCLRMGWWLNVIRSTPVHDVIKKEEIKAEAKNYYSEALKLAYETNDDYLVSLVSGMYGEAMCNLEDTEFAIMYLTNSTELYDKLNLSAPFTHYLVFSEMLWRVREYENTIKYAKKTISALQTSNNNLREIFIMRSYNTLALAYHRMEQYDSAFVYYEKAMQKQRIIHTPGWDGIIGGNMAQIYFVKGQYTAALPLFEMDYRISKENEFYDNAANSLQWAAKTNLALGNKAVSLVQVRESFNLLQKWPSANYLQNAYNTASEIFKSLGNSDSAYYYAGKYNKLHDSIERMIYQSSISISKLRLNEERNSYNIRRLQREKQEQVQQRNIIIGAILFLACIALLVINGQRRKIIFKQELAEKEKQNAEQENVRIQQEMESARVQLKMFTENIIEKTNLVEKLEKQLNTRTISVEEQQLISELSHQTILTENDWDNFKLLFEKIFPMFFQRLKNAAADITVAEQRMAALTRLQLSTRQMAAMLGISVDSVYKTKQRLRKRFNIAADANMEEFIAAI